MRIKFDDLINDIDGFHYELESEFEDYQVDYFEFPISIEDLAEPNVPPFILDAIGVKVNVRNRTFHDIKVIDANGAPEDILSNEEVGYIKNVLVEYGLFNYNISEVLKYEYSI